jgi:hypothetical protein
MSFDDLVFNGSNFNESAGILSVRIIGNSGKEGKGENQFSQPRGICMDRK